MWQKARQIKGVRYSSSVWVKAEKPTTSNEIRVDAEDGKLFEDNGPEFCTNVVWDKAPGPDKHMYIPAHALELIGEFKDSVRLVDYSEFILNGGSVDAEGSEKCLD